MKYRALVFVFTLAACGEHEVKTERVPPEVLQLILDTNVACSKAVLSTGVFDALEADMPQYLSLVTTTSADLIQLPNGDELTLSDGHIRFRHNELVLTASGDVIEQPWPGVTANRFIATVDDVFTIVQEESSLPRGDNSREEVVTRCAYSSKGYSILVTEVPIDFERRWYERSREVTTPADTARLWFRDGENRDGNIDASYCLNGTCTKLAVKPQCCLELLRFGDENSLRPNRLIPAEMSVVLQ